MILAVMEAEPTDTHETAPTFPTLPATALESFAGVWEIVDTMARRIVHQKPNPYWTIQQFSPEMLVALYNLHFSDYFGTLTLILQEPLPIRGFSGYQTQICLGLIEGREVLRWQRSIPFLSQDRG
jgi:hypothetical protein